MNPNVRRFINDTVNPNKDTIIKRSQALDWNLEEAVPSFLFQRLEDVKLLFLLGRDNALMKIIPVFVGEILVSTAIANKARYQEELPQIHQEYMSKNTGTILDELKSLHLIKESDYTYCKRYCSEQWLKILRKTKEEDQIKAEVEGAFMLLKNNAYILSTLTNLPEKKQYEYIRTLPKSKKFELSFTNKVDQNKLGDIFKKLPIIKTWQIGDDGFKLFLEFLLELSSADISNMLSPVLEKEFQCEPWIKKVTAALLIQDSKVLIARRSSEDIHGPKWEFPGGKVEEGETPEECLMREMEEEFKVKIKVGEFIASSIHNYEHGTIELMAYYIEILEGQLTPTVHAETKWVDIPELTSYELLPADVPIAEKLKEEYFERI